MAQNPCNNSAVQAADEAIVEELRTLLELKRKFLKRELDLSPLITLMLAEIQEQQSLMKTYEITIKKLESDVEAEGSEVDSLHKQFKDRLAFNKSLENKLNASGPLSMFDNINNISTLNLSHFLQVLHKALRSVRSFVKLMIKEMELANWDLDAAAKAIESGVVFVKQNHRCLAFESFVCRTMLEGFNLHDFCLGKELKPRKTDPEALALPIQVERKEASALLIQVERKEVSTLPIQVERKEVSTLPIQFEWKEASALPIQVERNEASALPIQVKRKDVSHFRFKCSFFHQEG
ncbi:Trehalose-phosphatase/synthase 7 isoform 1 [Hibiscus syriacus]|uniref:Trehalose-phosphatase/synthase 7 isoform 1 n=1 Tax=Hibiscus syriacus TaxID=106335 RepID=A0A6A2X443_HIBSY|nr:Trehalose-phosphatase/synthase 7 isoform 1 [Hibiscus syriacus]